MCPRITEARPIAGHRLELTFTDGARGEVDLRSDILGRGGVLVPLEDTAFFRQVSVDPEAGTIVWPNGVDMCPDVLYSRATGRPLPVPVTEAAGT
jgi:uncharacterized protein DUF2442